MPARAPAPEVWGFISQTERIKIKRTGNPAWVSGSFGFTEKRMAGIIFKSCKIYPAETRIARGGFMKRQEEISVKLSAESLEGFEQYLYERENAEATIEKYLRDVRAFFLYLGNEKNVDKKKLIGYKEWLLEQYKVSSVNSMLAALNQFLEYQGYIHLKIKRVKVQQRLFLKEEKELSQNEYRRLVRTAEKEGRRWLALCMETIASTGIRVSELKYFTAERVKKGRIEVYNKGKYRRIILPEFIRAKLLSYCRKRGIKSGCIFVDRKGNPKDRSSIWREMKRLKERSGISGEKIFPHNLRHLFARMYYRCTHDIAGLADLLGHSSLNVTRVYTSNTGRVYQMQLNRMNILKI